MEEPIKTQPKRYDYLKQYQFQKGNAGGPGRPKGKSLKEFAREFLMAMNDEDKATYLASLPEDLVWKMAEGNPETKTDVTSGGEKIVFMPQELLDKHKLPTSETKPI